MVVAARAWRLLEWMIDVVKEKVGRAGFQLGQQRLLKVMRVGGEVTRKGPAGVQNGLQRFGICSESKRDSSEH